MSATARELQDFLSFKKSVPAKILFVILIYRLLDIYPQGVYTLNMHDNKSKLIRRLKIIEGQVRGLQKMINEGVYCIDVITQTSAVKQGLSNIEDILMENHLDTCLVNQIKKGQTSQVAKEMLKVYKLKRK